MPDWPPITEPLLRERLAMDDEAFRAFITAVRAALPPRAFSPEVLATALSYPWERPARSFLLQGEHVDLLDDLAPDARGALLSARARGLDGSPRHPLLAFGSNAAPSTLARKLAHFDDDERRVLVLAGELHGFDVGAAAFPTAYGSMPATLFASAGTAVRAAVLWVSDAQFTQLCWTEIGYRLGRLDGVTFAPDQETEAIGGVLAYESRWGTFCPDGEPLALAAIPATGRTAAALTQDQLLSRAAALMLGAGHGAEALVRTTFEDIRALEAGTARIAATGRPLVSPAWRPWTPES